MCVGVAARVSSPKEGPKAPACAATCAAVNFECNVQRRFGQPCCDSGNGFLSAGLSHWCFHTVVPYAALGVEYVANAIPGGSWQPKIALATYSTPSAA